MNIEACLSHKTDDWKTPSNLYKAFMIKGYFDPCPLNAKFDGLVISWKKKTFVNPPYSDIKSWVDKAMFEAMRGCKIVMLLPVRTDTQWFKKLAYCAYSHFAFIEGRLKFNDVKGCAPFPSMFVVLDMKRFDVFSCTFEYLTKDSLERFCI